MISERERESESEIPNDIPELLYGHWYVQLHF